MNDYEDELKAEQPRSSAQRRSSEDGDPNPSFDNDAFVRNAPETGERTAKLPADIFNLEEEAEVDHPDAKSAPDWDQRKQALGFARKEPGVFKGAYRGAMGALGNAVTRVGAAGAQDSYTAGKVLGGVGSAAKGVVDTAKDLSKIGQGVDAAAGWKGEHSIMEQNIPYLGFNMNAIAKAELAPGIRVADTVKAGLQDGGTLLEVAGRGITAASGRRALDFGDDKRRRYMDQRDAFTSARDEMRAKLNAGERGGGKAAFQAAVGQTQAALQLGKAVNEYGIRPEYEYSMNESADINNMVAKRTNKARTMANPSFDPTNPNGGAQMQVAPGEVTFERNAGTDALNTSPDYQTTEELSAGKRAKMKAAPGEALKGLGRILDGSERGQEAVRKGEYLKGATQAALSGARTIGKGAATAAAAPLGLGPAASAVVDVGTVAAGGLLQAAGAGINAVGGVGDKAKKQRALELRNKHYFGQEHFLKESEAHVPGAEPEEEAKQVAEAPEHKDAVPSDPFFDSIRGRRIAERGLRVRDQLKEGDYEKGDRDAGLPQIDHGGALKNFWHNRMKRPLQKVGQSVFKPLALISKALGYGTGVIPAYKFFQNKKRKEAMEAATNRKANRRGGQLGQDDFELVNHPDADQPPAAPNYAAPEEQDKVLQSLEGRKADAAASRVELRGVLDEQNKNYESSKFSRGANSALKMEGRDIRKENVTAWTNFERHHNETRLDQKIADRKRERARDPQTGESFLERQKREYLEWYNKNKRFDYADADMGGVMQRLAASDPHAQQSPVQSGAAGVEIGHEVDLDKEEDGRSDGGSSRGSLQLSDDGAASDEESDALGQAVEQLRGRKRIGRGAAAVDALAARSRRPVQEIPEEEIEDDPFESWAPKPKFNPYPEAREQQAPLGFTPAAWADEQRIWKKMLRTTS